jgi:HSP20 family protein
VSCELPGLSQEEIEIKLADNVLTIAGERRVDRDSEAQQFHRIERSYGPFARSFTVPASIDAEKIAASYRGGVLCVVLPKRAEATPRRITVRVS